MNSHSKAVNRMFYLFFALVSSMGLPCSLSILGCSFYLASAWDRFCSAGLLSCPGLPLWFTISSAGVSLKGSREGRILSCLDVASLTHQVEVQSVNFKLMSTNSTSLASLFHVSAVESTRARSPAKIRKSMNIKIRGRLSSCRHRFIKFNDFSFSCCRCRLVFPCRKALAWWHGL